MLKEKAKLIILVVLVVVILFTGVFFGLPKSKEKTYDMEQAYEVSTYISDDIIANTQKCKVDLCLREEYTPENIGVDADDIVIASVISLDDADPTQGLFGVTEGKLLINTTLKGDLEQGQVIEYIKNGGVMKMSDWEATQPENANNKREYLRQQSGLNVDDMYINIIISDDIEIEEGYTYLVYLKENEDKYEIIGLDVGLRKVDIEYSSTISTQNLEIDTLRIMNNKTGEFESLENYINTYINNSDVE
jgi:hypothetical protein